MLGIAVIRNGEHRRVSSLSQEESKQRSPLLFFVLRQDLAKLARLDLDSGSSCLSLSEC